MIIETIINRIYLFACQR